MQIEVKYKLDLCEEGWWRLRMWVSKHSDNFDGGLFVLQRVNNAPGDLGQKSDMFVDTASYSDVTEYPLAEPGELSLFFRCCSMDITLEDTKEVQRAINGIRRDIAALVHSMELLA